MSEPLLDDETACLLAELADHFEMSAERTLKQVIEDTHRRLFDVTPTVVAANEPLRPRALPQSERTDELRADAVHGAAFVENKALMRPKKKSKCRYRGVSKLHDKFVAQVTCPKELRDYYLTNSNSAIYLGTFENELLAAKVVHAAIAIIDARKQKYGKKT